MGAQVPERRSRIADAGVEPLTARSLVLSALLGTRPPALPVRALVQLGSLFGVPEGSMRSALSRMVAAGDLTGDGGWYSLGDRLARRQAQQDAAQRRLSDPWDASWWLAIVDGEPRPVGVRRAFRADMRQHRLAELRPSLWLRPANVAGPEPSEGVLVVRGEIARRDPVALAAQLWDLPAIESQARRLVQLLGEANAWLEPGDPGALVDSFLLSVAVVRFLRTEPQLPPPLVGEDPAPDRLRDAYQAFERAHQSAMAAFLSSAAGARPGR
jgi:phenylacetic acid degradation operon negative regulatory protein